MSEFGEGLGSLGIKAAAQQIDDYMIKRGVSEETRSAVINSIGMMYEYIPYAIKQNKNPSDGKVLAEFLATKGSHVAKYFGNNNVNCGLAILDLLKSIHTATTSVQVANVPLATLTWGLAMLDLLEVGNSCEPVQMAYYEAFLRNSSVTIKPIRTSVRRMP